MLMEKFWSYYKKDCDDMEAFIANKSKPKELCEAVFRWMAEYTEDYHLLMSFTASSLKDFSIDFFDRCTVLPSQPCCPST